MDVDYLIIGQGICGSFLSHDLIRAGKTVLVIDESKPYTASKVASGVINPITGRRMVRTWEIDKLMPFAVQAYTHWGDEMGVQLIRQCNIFEFHSTPQIVTAFADRQPEESRYLHIPRDQQQWRKYFHYDFTMGEIGPCWLIDLHTLLANWRVKLLQERRLLEEPFLLQDCMVAPDHIKYNNITAQKVIFCDGAAGFNNPYFNRLPYARNKGEAVIVKIYGLPATNIFKQGLSIVPWRDGLFWVGSTYEWEFTDLLPSPGFGEKVSGLLTHWLKEPFEIMDHIASERPANMERRPFVGLHPVSTSVGLFNGMGTKGCSLAPYFSQEFAGHLASGSELSPQVDVKRFTKILSR